MIKVNAHILNYLSSDANINVIATLEDNFGKSCELEFDFQHDNGGTGETEGDGKQLPYVRPLDSLVIAKPRL